MRLNLKPKPDYSQWHPCFFWLPVLFKSNDGPRVLVWLERGEKRILSGVYAGRWVEVRTNDYYKGDLGDDR